MKRAVLVVIAGCFPYSQLPNDRPDPVLRKIADAKILDMQINLHKQPGLCPGKQGKLYVNAKVQWPGMQPVMRSLGNDVDSLDPAKFRISGPLLRGDARANLAPDADVLKSIEAGFAIDVVYQPEAKWSFHDTFKPEYSCFTGFYADGDGGAQGNGGNGGNNGDLGQNGSPGESGGRGGSGARGGRITAYATIVSTKFYDRLIAVIANDTFFLAPADKQLSFTARGGAGGSGGYGGAGGAGGDAPTKTVEERDSNGNTSNVTVATGAPGNGANGGTGGDGGDGGSGGSVEVTYDAQFPELRTLIVTDVSGGEAGPGGGGGDGGAGGRSSADRDPQQGAGGNGGNAGGNGRPGQAGRAVVRSGAVAGQFRSIPGIQLGGRATAQPQPQPESPPRRPVKSPKHRRH